MDRTIVLTLIIINADHKRFLISERSAQDVRNGLRLTECHMHRNSLTVSLTIHNVVKLAPSH